MNVAVSLVGENIRWNKAQYRSKCRPSDPGTRRAQAPVFWHRRSHAPATGDKAGLAQRCREKAVNHLQAATAGPVWGKRAKFTGLVMTPV